MQEGCRAALQGWLAAAATFLHLAWLCMVSQDEEVCQVHKPSLELPKPSCHCTASAPVCTKSGVGLSGLLWGGLIHPGSGGQLNAGWQAYMASLRGDHTAEVNS